MFKLSVMTATSCHLHLLAGMDVGHAVSLLVCCSYCVLLSGEHTVNVLWGDALHPLHLHSALQWLQHHGHRPIIPKIMLWCSQKMLDSKSQSLLSWSKLPEAPGEEKYLHTISNIKNFSYISDNVLSAQGHEKGGCLWNPPVFWVLAHCTAISPEHCWDQIWFNPELWQIYNCTSDLRCINLMPSHLFFFLLASSSS